MQDDSKTREGRLQRLEVLRSRIKELEQAKIEREGEPESLRKRADKLGSLLQNMPIMLNAFDCRGKLIVWNQECERVTGYGARQMVGNPKALEVLFPDVCYRQWVAARWTGLDSKRRHIEVKMTCRDGAVKTVLWSNVSDQLAVAGWAAWNIGLDITELKQTAEMLRILGIEMGELEVEEIEGEAPHLKSSDRDDLLFLLFRAIIKRRWAEQALETSEEKYRLLVMHMPDVVWTTDYQGNTTFISPNVEKVYGYRPEEIYAGGARLWFGRVHPEDVGRVRQAYKSLFEKGRRFDIEYRIKRKDGRWIWLHDRSIVTYEQDGVGYADGVFSDITERKEAERALRDSEERWRWLAQSVPDVILTVGKDGKIEFLNHTVAGFTPQCSIGTSIYDYVPPEQHHIIRRSIERVFRTGKADGYEIYGTGEHGPDTRWETRVVPVRREGRVVAVNLICADVTERKERQERLKQYKLLVESAHDAIFLKDLESRYIIANNKVLEALGLSRQQVMGRNDYELMVDKEQARRNMEDDKLVFQTGKAREMVKYMTGADGKGRWFEAIKIPHFGAGGDIIGLIGIARDVTERKRIEDELRTKDIAVASSINAIALADCQGKLTYVNKSFLRMWGYGGDKEVLGRAAGSFWESEDGAGRVIEALRDTGGWFGELTAVRKDGSKFEVQVSAHMVKDCSDSPICMMVSFVDITEQKKAEEQIRRLSSAVEQSIDGIAISDLEPRLVYVNSAFARMHGYLPGEMVGMEVAALHDEQQMDEFRRGLNGIKAQGSWAGEISHIKKDGTAFPTYMSVTLLRGSDGEPTGVLAVVRDISEAKRREKELHIYREKMARTEQLASLGTLSATIAHELTQPLTVVNISIESALARLGASFCSEDVLKKLRDSLTAVSSATSIVERFRNYARKSTEKTISEVDLREVADRIAALLAESARRSRIALRTEGMAELPVIYADEKDMEQLFFALLDNAIQAADGCTQHRLIIKGKAKGKHIELSFIDDCGGIEPENLGRIFEPFFTTKSAGEGTGLGLCVAERVVRRAGGKIRAESRPGEGSTFFVTLPVAGR